MEQTKFAFPFSQGQELGLTVHNFSATPLQCVTAEIVVEHKNKARREDQGKLKDTSLSVQIMHCHSWTVMGEHSSSIHTE